LGNSIQINSRKQEEKSSKDKIKLKEPTNKSI